jgi:hypothetical protein
MCNRIKKWVERGTRSDIPLCTRTNKWDERSSLDITVCKRVNKQDEGGM